MVLLDALVAVGDRPPTVAHLDHAARAESAADAAFVGTVARRLGCPVAVERVPVDAAAPGFEARARRARYAFLARIARGCGARVVAVAHHGDDQAETVLARVLRGTGASGLAAMRTRAPLPSADAEGIDVVRPLLEEPRATIDAYAHAAGIDYRDDPTNRDTRYARNRIRHDLLPRLRREFNPSVDGALRRVAALAADADRALAAAAAAVLEPLVVAFEPGRIALDRRGVRRLDAALARLVVREAVRRLDTVAPRVLGNRTTDDLTGAIRGSRRAHATWLVRDGLEATIDPDTVTLRAV